MTLVVLAGLALDIVRARPGKQRRSEPGARRVIYRPVVAENGFT